MKQTRRALLAGTCQSRQYLISRVARGRFVRGNLGGISGPTNRLMGGTRTDGPYYKGIQLAPRKPQTEEGDPLSLRGSQQSPLTGSGQGGDFLRGPRNGTLGQEVEEHGRPSSAYSEVWSGRERPYKAMPKGAVCREGVGGAHSVRRAAHESGGLKSLCRSDEERHIQRRGVMSRWLRRKYGEDRVSTARWNAKGLRKIHAPLVYLHLRHERLYLRESRMREIRTSGLGGGRRRVACGAPPPTRHR